MTEWSYSGATGPDRWGALDPAWVMADVGYRQSPVDLGAAIAGEVDALVLNYPLARVDLRWAGHGVKVVPAEPIVATVAGQPMHLVEVHAHTPAEHTIDGHVAAAEIHLVHRDQEDGLVVVGVFVEEGDRSIDGLSAMLRLPDEEATASVRLSDLLPDERAGVYSYQGSLTTPPCTEGVRWFVLADPLRVSPQQISELRSLQGPSSRPVQPLNGRRINRV